MNIKNNKINLLYIGPMGYSGSTLLDLLLNNHKDIISLGELMFYDKWYDNNYLCSCNNKIQNCEFWCKVRNNLKNPNRFKLDGIITSKWANHYPYWKPNDYKSSLFGAKQLELINYINKNIYNKYIVDSSKSIGRLKKLIASNLFNIKIIHLIRDPKAVAISNTNKKLRPSIGGYTKTSNIFILFCVGY